MHNVFQSIPALSEFHSWGLNCRVTICACLQFHGLIPSCFLKWLRQFTLLAVCSVYSILNFPRPYRSTIVFFLLLWLWFVSHVQKQFEFLSSFYFFYRVPTQIFPLCLQSPFLSLVFFFSKNVFTSALSFSFHTLSSVL